MGHQLNQKMFFQNGEMTMVLLRRKNVRSSDLGMMLFQKTLWTWETLWGFINEHYVFPSEKGKNDKNATLKIISNALQRFKHALNKYYVQRGLSLLNQFGYIMPNKWDTILQRSTPEAVALSEKKKELNVKN
jgi:hypothetical protein